MASHSSSAEGYGDVKSNENSTSSQTCSYNASLFSTKKGQHSKPNFMAALHLISQKHYSKMKSSKSSKNSNKLSKAILQNLRELPFQTYMQQPFKIDGNKFSKVTDGQKGEVKNMNSDNLRMDDMICTCTVCAHRGQLIFCDSCHLLYHLHCIKPPLLSIPYGNWECHVCKEKK